MSPVPTGNCRTRKLRSRASLADPPEAPADSYSQSLVDWRGLMAAIKCYCF